MSGAINLPELRAKIVFDDRQLAEASAKAAVLGEVLKKELGGGSGADQGVKNLAANVELASTNMATANKSGASLGATLASLGTVLGGSVIPALVVAAAALSPVVLLLGSFAAGLTAALSVAALAGGAFAALGAGVVLLGQRVNAVPLQKLTSDLGQMADRLGKQAAPMAAQLVSFLDELIPRVEATGRRLLTWFGQNLGASLRLAGQAADGFFAALDRLGGVLERFLAGAQARSASLGQIISEGVDVAIAATEGLLTNLLRLSDWFTARLPTYGPLVAGIMGGMGWVVQGLASAVGAFVDFFVRSWPKISSTAAWVWDQLKAGWNDVAPMLQQDLPLAIDLITADLDGMQRQGKPTGDTLREIGQGAAILADSLLQLAGMIAWVDRQGQFLIDWLNDVDRAGATLHGMIGNLIGDFERLLGLMGNAQSAFAGGSGLGALGGGGRVLHLQSGGFAPPGSIATVGEGGPETLVMGSTGGYVVPNGGYTDNRQFNVNVSGASMGQLDEVRVAELMRRYERLYA